MCTSVRPVTNSETQNLKLKLLKLKLNSIDYFLRALWIVINAHHLLMRITVRKKIFTNCWVNFTSPHHVRTSLRPVDWSHRRTPPGSTNRYLNPRSTFKSILCIIHQFQVNRTSSSQKATKNSTMIKLVSTRSDSTKTCSIRTSHSTKHVIPHRHHRDTKWKSQRSWRIVILAGFWC